MMRKVMQLGLLLISLMLLQPISTSYADVIPDESTVIIMGGTVKGLRNTTKRDAEITFNDLMADILKSFNTKLKIIIYDSTEEMKAAYDRGDIQGVFGTPLEYLLFDQTLVPRMAMRYKGVDLKQKLLILIRTKDKNKNIAAFKGSRISLSSLQDLEELYLNTLLLKSKQKEIPQFFKSRLDAKNSNVAIMDVFFNKSDMAIVRESEFKTAVELNPQLGKKLTIFAQSPNFITLVGATSKSQAGNIDQIINGLTALNNTENGLSMLGLVQAEGLMTITKKDLKEVYELVNENRDLKRK